MAQYVIQGGLKYVQLDDNSLAPVYVGLSLEGGTLVKLTTEQVTSLRNPVYPTDYPLPASQITSLQQVTVQNFPASFQVSNFPASFQVSNLPATYPLPNDQAANLAGVNTQLSSLTRGTGAIDANTLRVTLPTDQAANLAGVNTQLSSLTRGTGTIDANTLRVTLPTNQPVRTTTMTSISIPALTSGDRTIVTPTSGRALRLVNLVLTTAGQALAAIGLRAGTVAQGQTTLSGDMSIVDLAIDFQYPVALPVDRSFVINLPNATGGMTGFVTWWEE